MEDFWSKFSSPKLISGKTALPTSSRTNCAVMAQELMDKAAFKLNQTLMKPRQLVSQPLNSNNIPDEHCLSVTSDQPSKSVLAILSSSAPVIREIQALSELPSVKILSANQWGETEAGTQRCSITSPSVDKTGIQTCNTEPECASHSVGGNCMAPITGHSEIQMNTVSSVK